MKREEETWIWQLLDPGTPLDFQLSGTPLEFRPMPGWVAQSSGIAFHLFYFCCRGRVQGAIREASVTLIAGDAIWISPQTAFRFESPEPDRCMVLRFRLKVGKSSAPKVALKKEYRIGRMESSSETWMEILKQKPLWEGSADTLALRAALAGLLAGTFAGKKRKPAGIGRRFSAAEIRLLFDWLESLPISARPTLADVAGQLRLSAGYANQICRRSLGLSVERWLIVQRIKAASRQLEESTLTIGEIAERFGYSSLYFFSRQFRSVMKCGPREWRLRRQAS